MSNGSVKSGAGTLWKASLPAPWPPWLRPYKNEPSPFVVVLNFCGSATLILNVLVKPGFRVGPIPLHGFGGDAERFGDLLVLQAGEEPQFDDLGLNRIFPRQIV